jgi:hypothetical protein
MKLLLTFKTSADVFLCEKTCNGAGLGCLVTPVPRSLGVTCDYAVEFQNVGENDVYAVLELLKKNNLQYTKIFHSRLTAEGEVY